MSVSQYRQAAILRLRLLSGIFVLFFEPKETLELQVQTCHGMSHGDVSLMQERGMYLALCNIVPEYSLALKPAGGLDQASIWDTLLMAAPHAFAQSRQMHMQVRASGVATGQRALQSQASSEI